MDTAIETLKSQGIIKGSTYSYQSIANARSACYEHSVKPARIVHGNYPYYWVITPADAERLIRAGYELAE